MLGGELRQFRRQLLVPLNEGFPGVALRVPQLAVSLGPPEARPARPLQQDERLDEGLLELTEGGSLLGGEARFLDEHRKARKETLVNHRHRGRQFLGDRRSLLWKARELASSTAPISAFFMVRIADMWPPVDSRLFSGHPRAVASEQETAGGGS